MVFSSVTFLCAFLPVVFGLYCIVPTLRAKNVLLIIFSLLFYAYGEPVFVLLMIGSCIANYIFGLLLGYEQLPRKLILTLAVVSNIGVLIIFKYTDFLIRTVNDIFHIQIAETGITLPIGISFFTFQALSYVIDVYRDRELSQKNFFHILLYISYFPQLIAGPIIKYHDVQKQIETRSQNLAQISSGIRRFVFGLSKKVLIANTCAVIADDIFALQSAQMNIAIAWLGAIAYALQIYYDFSGYSDMAIGLAKMFGFNFKENFHYPYASDSIKEFWRRWHISLSTWFKEYLYIPLGGNRKGKVRTYVNKFIVFFATGLWHGANWTFVLWGLVHGTFSVLEETRISVCRIRFKFIRHLYALVVVICAFVIFRADTIKQAFVILGKMFTGFEFNLAYQSGFMENLSPLHIVALIFGIIFALPVKEVMEKVLEKHQKPYLCKNGIEINIPAICSVCTYLATICLLLMNVLSLSSNAYNPFIYFRF